MNYFSSSYLPIIYHKPYFESPINNFPESSHEEQNQRYVRILESENQLLKEKVQILEEKLKTYEQLERESQTNTPRKRKAHKQTFIFKCVYLNCKRTYQSVLALNLHIKIKHNGGTIREREAYAKLILECQRENNPIPDIKINFPPKFLENYRKKMSAIQNTNKQSPN